MDISVNEDFLASLFFLNRRLEILPEPYRGNPELTVIVDFSSYRKFIAKYLDVEDYLATETYKLRMYNSTNDIDSLLRCFYKDMALAITKEVWYSGERCTKIKHHLDGVGVLSDENISAYFEACHKVPKAASAIRETMREHNMRMKMELTETKYFEYPKLLYAMSSESGLYGAPFIRWSRV